VSKGKFYLEIDFEDDVSRPPSATNPDSSWMHYVIPAVAGIGGFNEQSPRLIEGMTCTAIHWKPPGAQDLEQIHHHLTDALRLADQRLGWSTLKEHSV